MSSETISLFLNKALQKILKDSSRRHTKLRDTIKTALDAIQASQLTPEPSPEWDKLANKLVIPLKCACETRQSKIMGTALDCLQKMMAYGLIRGTAIDEERPDKKLMESVIETIGTCFDFPDDNVQLQIIKAFLTAVTSPICDIHDTCLMNAIRSVYNEKIYLVTKNQVNITTAKATLTQMLNIVFQRLEATKSATGPDSNNNNNNNNNTTTSTPTTTFSSSSSTSNNNNNNDDIITSEITTAPAEPPKPTVLSSEPSFFSPPTSPTIRKSGDPSIHFTDCFLIFRALCKLSMKEVPEGAGPEAMDMKSKVLSLELIQMVLESSGPSFRHSERFINNAIKKYLCVSLLNNGVSPAPRVFKLSLSIFLSLMSHYREHLKAEIGVFFSKIFLWILESNNSTIQQKWMVLQVLYQICKNPQTLVDIYVNYDCDLEGKDIFERMVYDLSRIAQGGNTVTGDHFSGPAAQELKVKTLGLECLVTIMKSLVDWSKELYDQNEKENATDVPDVSSASSSTNSTEDLDALDVMRKQKQFKLVIETGKQKFNVSPKKGIDYLLQGEAIQRDVKSIATFLKTSEGLDKTRIGEYLGDSDPFVVSVLYAYVDLFSFSKMPIDAALRDILSYFRLPSDLHKIDRMLEKFAERYFNDNPNSSFANADAVYTLAFAVVTLLTNLHDSNEQTRMTKQDWFKMNKSCNGGEDFEYNMLYVIYDNCAHEPLRLRGEKDGYGTASSDPSNPIIPPTSSSSPAPTLSSLLVAPEASSLRSLATHFTNVLLFWSIDARQKQLRFIRESEELVRDSQASIQEKMKRKAKFFTATHIEHVRPMFELAWCPMLAAFSVLLEDSGDARVIALCLEGFNYAIQVACVFYMAIERSTFITSLSKFTLLDSLREMRPKNIESIKAVINIANSQGNYLQESWSQVLKCFSLLERLHVIGSGVKVNTLSEPDPKKYTRGFTAAEFFGAKPNPKAFEEVNAEYVAQQIDTSAVDRVYTNSVHLNNSAILSFVRSLCEVSVEEINNNSAPRIFSLQKLVEICYYNMNRLRIVWASIWTISAEHFTKIGCHDNKGIAMYAIDSLRQLSMKFLEKDELAHYTFQKEFLRPFEHIIHTNPSVEIRELVIRCLTQMIQAQGKNIKSGWKSVFLVFSTAAADKDAQIVTLAFNTVDHLMQDYFTAVADNFFIDCVSCVAKFGWNKHDSAISQKSIDWLNFCSGQLYNGKVEALPAPNKDGAIFTNSDRHTGLWFPILTGLTKITYYKDSAIRSSALQVLFRQLTMYGKSFSKDLWGLILQKVLLPIFEPTGYDGYSILTPVAEDNEWLNTTCTEAFRLLVEFYTEYFDTISYLLYPILDLVVACILQENETLSKKSLATLLQLTLGNGSKFTDEMWSTICSEYGQIFEQNIPSEIFQLQSQARAAPPTLHARTTSSDTSHTAPTSPVASLSAVTTPVFTSAPNIPYSVPNTLAQSIPQIAIDGPIDEVPTPSPRLAPIRVRKTSSTTNSILNDIARNIRAKCTVQLLSIQAVSDIFASQYSHLATHHMVSLIDTLDVAYNFTYKINREQGLQSLLSKLNLADLLHKIELQAILTYLQLLFKLYSESTVDSENRKHQAEIRLISRCAHILSNVEKGDVPLPADNPSSRDNPNNIAVVVQVLKGFLSVSEEQFSAHLPQFYGEFVDLMLHNNKEIRMVLSDVMQRVGPTFNIIPEFPTWLDKHQMDAFLDKPKPRVVPVVEEDLGATSTEELPSSSELPDELKSDDVSVVTSHSELIPEPTSTTTTTTTTTPPTEGTSEFVASTPIQEPIEESIQEAIKEPVQEAVQEPIHTPTEEPIEEPTKEEVQEPTPHEQQEESVVEQEVVSQPASEPESQSSSEAVLREVPLDQESESSENTPETTQDTPSVDVAAPAAVEQHTFDTSPESETFEPVSELSRSTEDVAEPFQPTSATEPAKQIEDTTPERADSSPEPTFETVHESTTPELTPVPLSEPVSTLSLEPTPELTIESTPDLASQLPEPTTESTIEPSNEATSEEPVASEVEQVSEPTPEATPEPTPESSTIVTPEQQFSEPTPELADSSPSPPNNESISDPSELISEHTSDPISEPSFESEPSEPSSSSNDKDSNDDFVMVDWPSQQHTQQKEEQKEEERESPEETPLIPLSSSSTDDATPLVESGEMEEIGGNDGDEEEDDELPDSPTFSDVPIFDSETATTLVDIATSSSSLHEPSQEEKEVEEEAEKEPNAKVGEGEEEKEQQEQHVDGSA